MLSIKGLAGLLFTSFDRLQATHSALFENMKMIHISHFDNVTILPFLNPLCLNFCMEGASQ